MANVSGGNKIKCCSCGYTMEPVKFFQSKSPVFSGIGRMPICKDCLAHQLALFTDQYRSERKAVQRLCMMFDIYYNDQIYRQVKKSGKEFDMGDYIKQSNLARGRGKTFTDNLLEGFTFGVEGDISTITSEAEKVPKKMIQFWGQGFMPEDYEKLQEHYDYMDKCNPNRSGNQELFLKDLCKINLKKEQAFKEDRTNDYKVTSQLYIDTFNQAGLSAKQAFDEVEGMTIGRIIKDIQEHTPADFYQDKERYKDFDGFDEYFERFLLRPMNNIVSGTSERDSEYFVPDEDE